MYNNIYEEYIRNIIGYPTNPTNNCYSCNMNIEEANYINPQAPKSKIEQCYPEIYKIIYPMVKKACNDNFNLNTEEEVDKITDEIYNAIEDSNQINININLENAVRTKQTENVNNRSQKEIIKNSTENRVESNLQKINERETRRISNNTLRDLIKILIIRELLGRPNVRPPKPPRPPHNRPPFPGFPGGGGPRPPIMPRDLEYSQDYYDIYEF